MDQVVKALTVVTLSFRQAFDAKESGRISWDEYIHNLLAQSVKDEDDDAAGSHRELSRIDPFGYSIWLWSERVGTIEGGHEALHP